MIDTSKIELSLAEAILAAAAARARVETADDVDQLANYGCDADYWERRRDRLKILLNNLRGEP